MSEVFVMSWQEREMFSQEWKFVKEAADHYTAALKTITVATNLSLGKDRIKYAV